MKHTIRYTSSRTELWHWYWKLWKRKFWYIHVLVALMVSLALSETINSHFGYVFFGKWFLISFPIVVLVFSSIPQIMFKKKERILEVNPDGWSTHIGKLFGSRKWEEVKSIIEENNQIIIAGTNGNALIIPEGAFNDTQDKQVFLNDIRCWHNQMGG